MTVRGSMDMVLKPGARKMAHSDSGAYKTPNMSKDKKKSFSRNYAGGGKGVKGGVRKAKHKPTSGAGHSSKSSPSSMGHGPRGGPTGGGGKSMAGGRFATKQGQGRGAPTPGRGGNRKVAV